MKLVKTSYSIDDVKILLQDVRGRVPVLDTEEREKLNQQGVHYSEMLPVEYSPSNEYLNLYFKSVKDFGEITANAVGVLAEKILKRKSHPVIVSLARAGTPIGILVKRYIEKFYNIKVPHYTVSIIRGKGLDKKAMKIILDEGALSENIVFLDGWVGKGAINKVLSQSVKELKEEDDRFKELSDDLAVLSDPASVTDLYGTREDFLIPNACLNSTVSGLISRTVKLKDMTDDELHGAVYYKENEVSDLSNGFVNIIMTFFDKIDLSYFDNISYNDSYKGLDEVIDISKHFNINDINKIKPGVGETTRVLLRRVPDRILVKKDANKKYLKHIYQLAKEKNIPVEIYPLKKYNVCGIIKDVADL